MLYWDGLLIANLLELLTIKFVYAIMPVFQCLLLNLAVYRGTNMNKVIAIFITVFSFTTFASNSLAYDDICKLAAKAKGMTSAEMDDYFKEKIEGWRIEGRGKIYDVRKNKSSVLRDSCTIIVRCEKDVFIYIEGIEYWGSVKDLKVNQRISFTGECKSLRWA